MLESPTPPTPPPPRPVVLLLGDSLTQFGAESDGWAVRLQRDLIRSADVLNRGLSGYNTRWFIAHALPALRAHELQPSRVAEVAVITLWLGANDAALPNGPSASQHVPIDEYRHNLETIIRELRALAPSATIILITPPVVDDDARRPQLPIKSDEDAVMAPLDRNNAVAGVYAAACGEVGEFLALSDPLLAVIDLHELCMTKFPTTDARRRLLSDGLHLSPEGNALVYRELHEALARLVPATLWSNWQLPDWKTLQ